MSYLFRGILTGIAHLIYPPTCWTCGEMTSGDGAAVCERCLPFLTHDPFPSCPRCSSTVGPHLALDKGCLSCANESFSFDGAFRMAPYEGLLRDVILRMKVWAGEELAEVIAALWAKQMKPRLTSLSPDLVIPIPLHWRRRWWRGFNTSDILAAALAQELHIRWDSRTIWRNRQTPLQQAQPSATARKENIKHAFTARAGVDLAGKTILLIDDVLTTGSTLNEAARTLKALNPKAIYAVVLAHG